jgi:hypothetical protein
VAASKGADMIVSEDWNGLNTGVFLLKNSEWSQVPLLPESFVYFLPDPALNLN